MVNSDSKVRAIIVAIHGILTRTTSPSWPDALDAFLPDCKVERRYYFAGPFPIFEHFVKNPRLARVLADEIAMVKRNLPGVPLHFVAHSNGCDIALQTIQLLAKRGIRTDSAILTAAVIDPDVDRSGVTKLILDRQLGRAYAYCSKLDRALALPLKWPYKDLGRTGWMASGEPFRSLSVITRRFDGYDHCDYFAPAHERATFAQMQRDMGLA